MDIFDRIDGLVKEHGISGAELIRQIGGSNGLYSQWKSRMQNPSNEKIKKIADYFGVSVDYLIGEEPTKKAPIQKDEGMSSAEKVQSIISQIVSMDETEVDDLFDYVEKKRNR